MIIDSYYLSDSKNLRRAVEDTGLDEFEIEELVGRFTRMSQWEGELRGEVVIYHDKVRLRHHFNKSKIYFEDNLECHEIEGEFVW
jgi:hypothetical protein